MSVDFPSSTEPQASRRRAGSAASLSASFIEKLPHSSKIPLALLPFHRARFVNVDEASLTFGGGRGAHFRNDVVERLRRGLDRARQRIAAERAKSHPRHARPLA